MSVPGSATPSHVMMTLLTLPYPPGTAPFGRSTDSAVTSNPTQYSTAGTGAGRAREPSNSVNDVPQPNPARVTELPCPALPISFSSVLADLY